MTRNRTGPKIDPRDTPEIIYASFDKIALTDTFCKRPARKDLIQARIFPWIPFLFNLFNRMEWSTLSKALLKSR